VVNGEKAFPATCIVLFGFILSEIKEMWSIVPVAFYMDGEKSTIARQSDHHFCTAVTSYITEKQ